MVSEIDPSRPKILLIGASGQVGRELAATLAAVGSVDARDRSTLDLTDRDALRRVIDHAPPALIVNAAAYTQVDRAESEPELATLINATAPAVIARAARECGARLIHYSTDYVFDGRSAVPYREDDATNPRNVYGRTKRDGDVAVLASGAHAFILRVSWVYGLHGKNFLQTIRRLAREGQPLRIVSDQHGSPTWARAIAEASAAVARRILSSDDAKAGVYHLAAPDHTTWADFAQAIVDATPGVPRRVTPITTADYPTPASRPPWSVLDATRIAQTFGVRLAPWREQLRACLAAE